MRERSVTVGGMSKSYSVTGWRVGTMIAPPALTHAFHLAHDFVSIGAAAPLQEAGAVAYRLPREYYAALAAGYQARRDRLCRALIGVGFELDLPQGAYYVMAAIDAFGAADDVTFARHLVREVGVATVPGSSFFVDKALDRRYVHFCFCKCDATLDDAAGRLGGVAGRRLSIRANPRRFSSSTRMRSVPIGRRHAIACPTMWHPRRTPAVLSNRRRL